MIKNIRLFLIMLLSFNGVKSYAQTDNHQKLANYISDQVESDRIPDSNAIHTFYVKFIISNKKLKKWELSKSENTVFFKKSLFSDFDISNVTNRKNIVLILPLAFFVNSSNREPYYTVGIDNQAINSKLIQDLFYLAGTDKKDLVYLKPIVIMFDKTVFH